MGNVIVGKGRILGLVALASKVPKVSEHCFAWKKK
jgi:hypothetical protein